MTAQQVLHLRQEDRLRTRLGERHVDVVVQDHDEPNLAREVENAVERRVGQARSVASDL